MDRGMIDYLTNSVTSSVVSTVIVLLLAIPAAYALSIRPIKSVQDALFFFISTRFMPAAASLLPLYMIFNQAVSGTWSGALRPAATTSRLDMLIDYYRITQPTA